MPLCGCGPTALAANLDETGGSGSEPVTIWNLIPPYVLVAQLVEPSNDNREVDGSRPSGNTMAP